MRPTTLLPTLTLLVLTTLPTAHAGPAAYGVCQAGCAAVVMACYAATGVVWGTAPPLAIPAVLACDSSFGVCQAACWAAIIAPTP